MATISLSNLLPSVLSAVLSTGTAATPAVPFIPPIPS